MELFLKSIVSPRKYLMFMGLLVLGLAQQVSAQSNAIGGYPGLIAALNSGATTITNFNSAVQIPVIPGQTIQITNNIVIDAGSNSVVIYSSGTNGGTRLFNVHAGASLALNNIAMTGGSSTNGGAIYNAGNLTVSNCVFVNNYAINSNGIAGGNGFSTGGNGTNGTSGFTASGGAIYSTGPLNISFCQFNTNFALGGNGGNGGNVIGQAGNGGNAGYGGDAYGGAICSIGTNNIIFMTEFLGNACIAGFGGAGGAYATNAVAPNGLGGTAGLGGSCAGGAVFVSGSLFMTNCLFTINVAEAGSTGPAEVDADGGGEDGSIGGAAFGGALYIAPKTPSASILNTIIYDNATYGGFGGSTALTAAIGGTGGEAIGGGLWSGATLTQMSFCTVATNFVVPGAGGTNTGGGLYGTNGPDLGWGIYRGGGAIQMADSILSYTGDSNNVGVGITDEGYNIVSDQSLAKNAYVTTTKLNANPHIYPGLTSNPYQIQVGGTNGSEMLTLTVLSNSPAVAFIPGVPGLTFPDIDEAFDARGTPTTAGAVEEAVFNPTGNSLPTIDSTLPGTNFTGAGGTVYFTNTVDLKDYTGYPFGYQWQLDGTNINDDANFTGTTTNILTVRHITIYDQGLYTCVVSPTLLIGATVSSNVALILTNPPTVKGQPVSELDRPAGSIVTFTLNVESALDYNYRWMLNGSPLPDSPEFSGTNNNTLTIDPATAIDAGSYFVVVSNNYGAKTSSVVRLTIVPDKTRPAIAITSPLANARTNAAFASGTATDNAQVTNVIYTFTNINNGVTNVSMSGFAPFTMTSTNFNRPTTVAWSITNEPLPGTNILAVQSVDYSGNVSTIVTRRFFYKVPSPFTLTISSNGGGGTIIGHASIAKDAGPSNNATLNIGEGYTLVATPGARSVVGSWTNISGTNVTVSTGNTLKFVMESNTIIDLAYVSNIFLLTHGTYNGLFYVLPQFESNQISTNTVVTNNMTNTVVTTNAIDSNAIAFESAGMLGNLVIGDTGAFTGKLLLAGGSYNLAGNFGGYGEVTNYVIERTAAQGGPLTLNMSLNTSNNIITGTVSNAAWPSNAYLWAGPAAALTGSAQYTVLMSPDAGLSNNGAIPPGYSYALIGLRGPTATISGGLADGTTFNQTVPVNSADNIPIYASLYSKTGFLFGWLNLTNLGANDLMWIEGVPKKPSALFPAGFTNMLAVEGSPWTSSSAITVAASNALVISNATLDLDYTVAVKGNNTLYNASSSPANSLTGTINLKTGLMQLTFGNGNGRSTTRGFGAMLQDTNFAGGYFILGTDAGIISLEGVSPQINQVSSVGSGSEGQELEMITGIGSSSAPPLPPPLAQTVGQATGTNDAPPTP
jgi:hypothetical protein